MANSEIPGVTWEDKAAKAFIYGGLTGLFGLLLLGTLGGAAGAAIGGYVGWRRAGRSRA